MNRKIGPEEAQGPRNAKIERLHQQFDPDEKFPVDPEDTGPERSEKQLVKQLRDPQKGNKNVE